MPTDDERRAVARRIRETGEDLGSSALLWYHIAKALGVRTATDGKTACGMLADLIEPSEPKVRCVAEVKVDGEKLEELVHDAVVELTGIDLDELLALAGDMQDDAAICPHEDCRDHIAAYARSIREALGVDK